VHGVHSPLVGDLLELSPSHEMTSTEDSVAATSDVDIDDAELAASDDAVVDDAELIAILSSIPLVAAASEESLLHDGDVFLGELPSRGAIHHASGECTPCTYFLKPHGCRMGHNCAFCHACHTLAVAKRKQRQSNKARKLKIKSGTKSEGICDELSKLPGGSACCPTTSVVEPRTSMPLGTGWSRQIMLEYATMTAPFLCNDDTTRRVCRVVPAMR
jgi:hypothetical protein